MTEPPTIRNVQRVAFNREEIWSILFPKDGARIVLVASDGNGDFPFGVYLAQMQGGHIVTARTAVEARTRWQARNLLLDVFGGRSRIEVLDAGRLAQCSQLYNDWQPPVYIEVRAERAKFRDWLRCTIRALWPFGERLPR